MLEEHGMQDCKQITSPLPDDYLLDPAPQTPPSSTFNYRRAVGLLGYLVQKTRPDLAHAHSYFSQFLNAPTSHHQHCFSHLLRYLSYSSDLGLTLGGEPSEPWMLQGFADANYGLSADRRSFLGSAIILKGLLGWRCAKQPIVTLSTTEAKHCACTKTAQHLLWCKKLISQVFRTFSLPLPPSTLYCDNQGAIDLILNPLYQHCTRHIDIFLHFLCQHVHKNDFQLSYISTNLNLANSLTKLVSPKKFWKCITQF